MFETVTMVISTFHCFRNNDTAKIRVTICNEPHSHAFLKGRQPNIETYHHIHVNTINNSLPIDLVLEKRCLKFIWLSINSNNILAKSVSSSVIDDSLRFDDLQFAHKSKISAIHCVNSVNETVNYYINNSGKVYVCTLDASKAFDRVNLRTLFKKLFERHMCPLFLRFFIHSYYLM